MKTSFAKVHSAQIQYLEGEVVDVEVDVSRGLYAFSIVGLPDKAVEEARDRVSAAIKHSGFDSPKSKNQKVVISLAPADLKKEGPIFDLPIALSYLLASGEIKFNPEEKIFVGELSLDGKIRSIRGVLPTVSFAKKAGFKEIFIPKSNSEEASLVDDITIFGVSSLAEVIDHLEGRKKIIPVKHKKPSFKEYQFVFDIGDIKGQHQAKRGLEIAAAGGHNIALFGPAGTGKTMLAKALPGILPPLDWEEVLEVTSIHSIAGTLQEPLISTAPFRSPHHTSSYVSLVGGGAIPKPGEITLAHRGILFLDEFPEFERRVIDALRQPLEDRNISISRSKGSGLFPASVILIAALNPCPCGNFGSTKECVCSPKDLARYKKRLSGPIVDRIDMWIEVPLIRHELLGSKERGEESEEVRKRVIAAREKQKERFKNKKKLTLNAEMGPKDIDELILLDDSLIELLNSSARKLNLSPRSYHKLIKLSRTIADLENSHEVKREHLLEALQYRQKVS